MKLAIALDLGGTQIRAALVDADGQVHQRASLATAAAAGPTAVIGQLHEVAASVSQGVPRADVLGVGVASPGPLDTAAGVALGIPTLAGFVDLPLRSMLEERLQFPVWLENDGIAAALGEWRFGAGRGHSHLVYVTVSTGIGGGVVADGRLLRGRQGLAGHIGHMTIVCDGEPCACGNRGCWEAYASGTAFGRRAQARAAGHSSLLASAAATIDGRAVFLAAERGDPLATALVAEEADLLGTGIANLLHLYSPEIVVIGGGMSADFPALQPGIAARIRQAAMPAFRAVPVVRAALHGNSGLIGAACLVFDAQPDLLPA